MPTAAPFEWLSTWHTWLYDRATRLTLSVLAAGPLPRHIGFIMDGNRRYARHEGKPIAQGHMDGFRSLQRILECCLRLRVRCVSVYAFAVENFNRSPDEVKALMSLLKDKMIEISEQGQILDQYGVRLNIVGKRDLLSPDVRDIVENVEEMTAKNHRAVLNVCMPYASRDEMAAAVRSTIASFENGDLSPDDVTECELDSRLWTSLCGSPPLDILVRTSGVNRLSDFLLWQSCESTQVHFVSCYWPEFGLRDLVPILLDYQLKKWATQPVRTALVHEQ